MIFVSAKRVMPFWIAYSFMILAALSPISIYTSMFLPESMFFFFIGLTMMAAVKSIRAFTWQNWAVTGLTIGLASLVKPHAWLSAIAIGITLVIVGLSNGRSGIRGTSLGALALIASAGLSRLIFGFVIGGPKAIGFFGQYLGVGTFEAATQQSVAGPSPYLSPIDGVLSLFWPQLLIHLQSVFALMAIVVVAMVASLIAQGRKRDLSESHALVLLVTVWLGVMMVTIVVFTGWVTGGGDDHTTRVLLRYYDFLFVIVPLAGLGALFNGRAVELGVVSRWTLSLVAGAAISGAFSGFFSTLTIQIADAPNLAGLVVNSDVFNAVAILGFLCLAVFATFPRMTAYATSVFLCASMVLVGWQTQDQYQIARGQEQSFDVAGRLLAESISRNDMQSVWVLASSRFNATALAMAADFPNLVTYDLYLPGSTLSLDDAPTGTDVVVTLDDINVVGDLSEFAVGPGYKILKTRSSE